MRHGHIELDLSTVEFLTHQDEERLKSVSSKNADHLLVRDGNPDPKKTSFGAHPEGEPIRIARDRISGVYFAKIADHIPAELNTPHLEKQHKRIHEAKPFHVPGQGYWVPLKELFPQHPHAQSHPIRTAHETSKP